MLRDILKDEDPGIAAVVETIAHVEPDILLLTGIDWDLGNVALGALARRLDQAGHPFPHLIALRPNTGMPTGLDMDGDGRTGGPGDAQGFGRFAGNGGMAILSRYPVDMAGVTDLGGLLWADSPGATLPVVDGQPYPSAAALAVQRLSSVGHWDVPVILPDGTGLHLLAFHAGPPVFDGPEDRNGLRNHDEVMLWPRYLDGDLEFPPPEAPVVVIGQANLDPMDGEGLREALHTLLAYPRLQDPAPRSAGAAEASAHQGGVNATQSGDPALDTADWRDEDGPGNLRVSYILPDRRLHVAAEGVVWPAIGDPLRPLIDAKGAPRHRMVWVDIDLP